MRRIEIRKSEVLRYLGVHHQIVDQEIEGLIHRGIEELKEIARPQRLVQGFGLQWEGDRVQIFGASLPLKGNSIVQFLRRSPQCYLMAVTLGIEVDRRIHRYQVKEMTRAVILDACASVGVEAICQEVQEELRALAAKEGQCITSRFSPGYGDFPLEIQGEFLRLLNGQKIGLTVTSHHLLIPRKSVTAIIGGGPQPMEQGDHPCDSCLGKDHCEKKKGGITCGIH